MPLLVLIICLLAYLLRREMTLHKSAIAYSICLFKEKQAQEKHLRDIFNVIEKCAGGVNIRISEHHEIMNAIGINAPDLLSTEPAIRYWLRADHLFYKTLRDAAISSERRVTSTL